MNRGKIVIISGPSGSGKTTLHQKLLTSKKFQGKLVKSISATTRSRRPGERHGRDYLFLTKKEFLEKIKAGQFLEWQKVFTNYYGTPQKRVEQLLKAGKNVLLCIDVKGARVVHRKVPDALRIFVKAPSLAILRKRLEARSSENRQDLRLRLKTAKKELAEARNYDHVVVNDQLSRAFQELQKILSRTLRDSK